jgi:hypothetical protein
MSRQERDNSGRVVTDRIVTTREGPEVTSTTTTPVTSTFPTTTPTSREGISGPVTWEEMRALLRREPAMYERTWRPTVGGLLEIIAGSWNFLLGLGALLSGTFFSDLIPTIGGFTGGFGTTGVSAGAALLVLGIVSIIGGALALSRRGWPMVLAGSITALIPTPLILPFIMGFFALIFNVLGHKEFWGPAQVQKDIASNIQHAKDKNR